MPRSARNQNNDSDQNQTLAHAQPLRRQPHLPIEIIHRVIDFLSSSSCCSSSSSSPSSALKSCALVSRAFAPYARQKLFSKHLCLRQDQIKPFLKLCGNRYSTMKGVLRGLEVLCVGRDDSESLNEEKCGCRERERRRANAGKGELEEERTKRKRKAEFSDRASGVFDQLFKYRFNSSDGVGEETMTTIVDFLSNVRMMRLASVRWKSLEGRARCALHGGFQNVVSLDLRYAQFERSEEFVSFICSFPLLEEVRLRENRVSSSSPGSGSTRWIYKTLKNTTMSKSTAEAPRKSPESSPKLKPALRRIEEYLDDERILDALVPLSGSLRALGISFCAKDLSGPVSSRLACISQLLAAAGLLEELVITINADGDGNGAGFAIPAFFTQLTLPSNAHIRHLKISTRHPQYVLPLLRNIASAPSRSPSQPHSLLEILELPEMIGHNFKWTDLDALLGTHWFYSALVEVKTPVVTKFYKTDVATSAKAKVEGACYSRPDEGSKAETRMERKVRFVKRSMPICSARGTVRVVEVYRFRPSARRRKIRLPLYMASDYRPQVGVVARRPAVRKSRLRSAIGTVVKAMKNRRGPST